MTEEETAKVSKFLSLILRHKSERVKLKSDEAGWVSVEELLHAVKRHGITLTLDELKHVIATSDKMRFAISDDGQRIRASRGHSVEIVDDGPGIAPEVQSHWFEPFFSTKPVGSGTGLGLIVSDRIVADRHGGEIEFKSRPGDTRFKGRLPVNQKPGNGNNAISTENGI